MTTLNQYARPEWAGPRKETWYEHLLPQRVTDTINQSPLVGALSKYMSSPPPDLTLPSERDSKVPMPRSPSWFDDRPVATEALDKFGLLANFIGPGAKLPPPAPKPQGIRAYHGSPHDFDRFDMSKIGTGEGAQAYGRGLYFAEAEATAKSYRDAVVPQSYAGTPEHTLALVARQLNKGHDHGQRVIETLGRMGERDAALMAKRLLAEGKPLPDMPPGRMYEVKINADPETFLDWDKPLSQQNSSVHEGVDKLLSLFPADRPLDKAKLKPSDVIEMAGRGRAEEALREYGIPGVKYLDQGSRSAGQGSRNYVVFDDALIEILRKYGLLPPVAAGAASLAQGQEPPL